MEALPEDLRALVAEREAARRDGDYATADALRRRLRARGFDLIDRPEGPSVVPVALEPAVPARPVRSEDVESLLEVPATAEASLQWVVQGWPEDVVRGIESFRRHHRGRSLQFVVVDESGLDLPSFGRGVEVVRLVPGSGWAAARNAGLRRAAGRMVVLADGSLEATGDVLTPLGRALADPTVGVTGPFGVVTRDLRAFEESPGPEVDAVESYLIAARRELFESGVLFDRGFRFYRMADVDLSFQAKARALRATVTAVPVCRHEHRVWTSTPGDRRARLSKRNFYRFLDRWRGRHDLLVLRSAAPPASDRGR
jgi:hypothetical protein